MKNKYFNDLTPKEILSETIVYDNGGETYDRYTIFTPDGSVFGMSEDAKGFNQFLGDHSEIEEGDHLGKKLKGVPKAIQNAVLERMEDEEDSYGDGGSIAKGNYQMILSQAKEVKHHANELQNILKNEKDIDAWVVAKMENVSSTLSDITHYLDGKTEYGDGGVIENIKGEYQIAGNDGGGVWTYSKRTADEIASKYKGSVQEDGSKWYVSLSRFSDGGEVDDDDLIEDDDNEYANGGQTTIPIQVVIDGDFDEPKFFKTFSLAKKFVLDNVDKYDMEILDSYGDSIYVEKNSTKRDLDFLFGDTKYSNGGSIEDMMKKYELNRMMVRSKVALAIGIDDAMRYLDQDFVVSPYSLLEGAVNKGFIDAQEIDKNLWESALSEAYSIDDMYRDSGQGIGGSDMNAFISSMLNDAGIKIEVVNNRYERVDKKFAKGGGVESKYSIEQDKNGDWMVVNNEKGMYVDRIFNSQSEAENFIRERNVQRNLVGFESYFAKGGGVGKHKSKFEVDDVVYNKKTKTIGIVRMKDDKYGEVKTDADGNVDVDDLEHYNPLKYEHQGKADVAPSTKKEIEERMLWKPFATEKMAKGGEVESTIDILMTEEPKVWDKFGFNSGSEIRASKDKTKKYAQELERVFTAKGIKKGSLTKKINEDLTDENYHLLNEFLTRNGYFNSKLTDELLKSYNNPVYSGAYADKESITIEAKAKPKSSGAKKIQRKKLSAKTTYIPNREIEEVDLKSGKKIAGSDIVDGVYKKK